MEQYLAQIAAAAPEKTVLGGPRGACPYKRVVILRKKNGYQAEQYTDKQVFHNNIPEDSLAAALADYMNLGFAQLDAFALYRKQVEGENAWESYVKLCAMGGMYGYFETLDRAGLPNPLDPENVKQLAGFVSQQAELLKQRLG